MPKVLSYGIDVRGGVRAGRYLEVPVLAGEPAAAGEGSVWVTTDGPVPALNYRQNGTTFSLTPADLDEEGVRDVVGGLLRAGNNVTLAYDDVADTLTVGLDTLTAADIDGFIASVRGAFSGGSTATAATTVADGVVSVAVTDSPTVGGRTPAYLLNVDNHVDGTTNRVFTTGDETKLTGIAEGATRNQTDSFLLDRGNHSGTQLAATISDFIEAARGVFTIEDTGTLDLDYVAGRLRGAVLDSPLLGGNTPAFYRSVDNHVDGTTNHVFTAADDDKLAGIAAGATKNATDAALRDRATHTGTQTAATISDFGSAVAALAIDAATLNGATRAQIETAVINAITDGAPDLLNTLRELSTAIGDDPNFSATLTALAGSRSRNFAADVPAATMNAEGVASVTITHGFGTYDVLGAVFPTTGTRQDEGYLIGRPTVNTVSVTAEGADIPAGLRIVLHAVGTV